MPAAHIVILGAGFAGFATADHLTRSMSAGDQYTITVVDQNDFSLFTPMLTEVAGGQVDPDEIVSPVRSLGRRVTFEQGRVNSIDTGAKTVTLTIGEGRQGVPEVERTIQADHLVVALGSVNNFHHIPGVQEHSLTIKSLEDAAAIRARMVSLLERADEEPDASKRRPLLTFVVGGGGFSGVETMAAINDMARDLVDAFPRVQSSDIRAVIAQPGERLLPELNSGLAGYAQTRLEARGVEVKLHTEVTGAGADYVELKDSKSGQSERIPTYTLIWAGGVRPNPVVDSAGFALGKHHGIVVDGCCQVQNHPNIWALGDCAEIPKPGGQETYAPTAQNAMREGALVASNIIATLRGQQPKPFVYRPIGELAIIGKRTGVASVYGFHVSGFPAWAMWRMIYLAKMPSMPKRIQIGVDWVLDLAFGRDVVARAQPSREAESDAG